MKRRVIYWIGALLALAVSLQAACGCSWRGGVDLAAAKAIETIAAETQLAITEYKSDLQEADDFRRRAVIAAFMRRLDESDSAGREKHVDEFCKALDRIDADRQVNWRRYLVTEGNLRLLTDVAAGMQELSARDYQLQNRIKTSLEGITGLGLSELLPENREIKPLERKGE